VEATRKRKEPQRHMARQIKPGDLLLVRWKDILHNSAWLSLEKAEQVMPMNCISIGFLISQDDKNLRLCSCISQDGDRDAIVIPKGCIDKIEQINYDKNKIKCG